MSRRAHPASTVVTVTQARVCACVSPATGDAARGAQLLDRMYSDHRERVDALWPAYVDHASALLETAEEVATKARAEAAAAVTALNELLTNAVFAYNPDDPASNVRSLKKVLAQVRVFVCSRVVACAVLCVFMCVAPSVTPRMLYRSTRVDWRRIRPWLPSQASCWPSKQRKHEVRWCCCSLSVRGQLLRKRLYTVWPGNIEAVLAHADGVLASNKDLMDAICPSFLDDVTAWVEEEEEAEKLKPRWAARPKLNNANDSFTTTVLTFTLDTAAESLHIMKALLPQVCSADRANAVCPYASVVRMCAVRHLCAGDCRGRRCRRVHARCRRRAGRHRRRHGQRCGGCTCLADLTCSRDSRLTRVDMQARCRMCEAT